MFLSNSGSPAVISSMSYDLDKAFWVCHPLAVAKAFGTDMPFTFSHENLGCYGLRTSWVADRGTRPAQFGVVGTALSDGLDIKIMTQHCLLDFERRVNHACRLTHIWNVSSEPPTASCLFCIVSIAPMYGIFRTHHP